LIIGAFAAGLILHATPERREVEHATTGLGHFFVPVFFAGIGAAMDLRSLADGRVLAIGGALVAVGVAGKLAAGIAPWWIKGHRTLIGVAMIPRGEVGLIFAQMGLASGALDAGLFSAVLLMVMATTFIAPPWLALLARGEPGPSPPPPDDGPGLDDLVSGPR
jgi:Kef-type K+ transport system membrane component KefB